MPIANGVIQLLMLLKKLLQKSYRLLKSCLHQLYLNKIITQLLFTPAANLVTVFVQSAKVTNSIANGTNSFANGTKLIAKRTNSIAKTYINREQHKKHLYNQSSHFGKYGMHDHQTARPSY